MSNPVVEFIKETLKDSIVDCLSGTFTFKDNKCTLEERGGVYGIAIKLSTEKAKDFFDEHNEKKSLKFKDWKSIGNNYYPLYWGKDSNLGFRLFDHTKSRDSTATAQLDSRHYLKSYTVIYGAMFCKDPKTSEKRLRTSKQDIFKTHKGHFDFSKK
jgi:hypothetical protein